MRTLKLLLACCLFFLLAACGEPPVQHQESFVFGTRVEVLVADADPAQAQTAIATVLREFDRLHRAYHAWQPSDLTALNEAIAQGKSAEVSPELAALIVESQRIARDGDGLFDPGIGRLIGLWGFQNDEFAARLPDPAALAAWLASHPSISDLKVEGSRVSSSNRDVALDFGGYLKGVALDRAAAILRAQGIRDALINIGGNVMALGSKHGKPWRVGIQHPRQPGPLAALDLHDGEAIGTSGDYQRFFELDGHRYCHLLDPRSGHPVEHTEALTVLIPGGSEAGMRSDALSKPLFIAGPEHWRDYAQKLGVTQALRIGSDGSMQVTAALAARLQFVGDKPAMTILP
jgi:FAD:protein FMN transferase